MILLRLLVAHIIADFFLQPTKWLEGKHRNGIRSVYLYSHAAVVGLLTYLFLGHWTHWQLPLFVMVTHYLIDIWKLSKEDTVGYFVADQLLHLLMLLIGVGWFFRFPWLPDIINSRHIWILLFSYLIILRPTGFFIEKLTARWSSELDALAEMFDGLNNAGTWIGYLERLIILTLMLFGHFSAIGFVIAAKSIFRFNGNVQTERDRKMTEYVLIGTLLSFVIAIFIGIIARLFLF